MGQFFRFFEQEGCAISRLSSHVSEGDILGTHEPLAVAYLREEEQDRW
jgi:hypothetical protein